MKRSINLIILLILCSFNSAYSQTVSSEGIIPNLEIKQNSIISSFDEGFILVTIYEIQYYSKSTSKLTSKNWDELELKEVDYKEKKKANIIVESSPFKPVATWKTETGFSILVFYKPEGANSKLIKYNLDNSLNLKSEEILSSIARPTDKSLEYNFIVCEKAENSNYFVYSQLSTFKNDPIAKLEYVILNSDLNVHSKGKMTLPEIKATNSYPTKADKLKTSINSIEILQEGDPIINLDGTLYLIHDDELEPLDIKPEKSIDSYKLLQDKNKDVILVGTYHDGDNGKDRARGYVVMKLSDDLQVAEQEYVPFSNEFELGATELIKKRHSIATSKDLGVDNKGPFVSELNAKIIDANINEKGVISLVFCGYSQYQGVPNVPENIAMIAIDAEMNLIGEHTFPYEFADYFLLNPHQKFEVYFDANEMYLFATDYPENYNDKGEYAPSSEKIKYHTQNFITVALSYDFVSKTYTHKKLSIKIGDRIDNLFELRKIDFPTEDYIILEYNDKDSALYGTVSFE